MEWKEALEPMARLLRERPLARFCLGCLAGVAVVVLPSQGHFATGPVPWLTGLAVVCLLLGVFPSLASSNTEPARGGALLRSLNSLFLASISFALGAAISAFQIRIPPTDICHLASPHLVVVDGAAVSDQKILPFGVSMEMDCWRVTCGPAVYPVSGRVELWIPRTNRPGPLEGGRWPRPGDFLRITGVLQAIGPGSKPVDANLILHRIYATVRVGNGGHIRVLTTGKWSLQAYCLWAREWALTGLQGCLRHRELAALAGMLFHQKEEMSPGVLDDLQQTGTSHIIATAGLHVGIFLCTCLYFLRFLLPRRVAVLLTMILVGAYCIACGAYPAVFRAAVVAELALLAWLVGRLPDSATCLSLAALVMTLLNPYAVLDAGFQFTFLTVGTILLLMPLLGQEPEQRDWVSRLRHHGKSIFFLSLGAQLGSWPLTAADFSIVSFVGIFANLLIVPLLAVIIPLALLTAVCGHLFPPGAVLLGPLLQGLIRLLLATAHWLAALPHAWIYWDNISWPAILSYYVVLLAGLGWLRLQQKERGQFEGWVL